MPSMPQHILAPFPLVLCLLGLTSHHASAQSIVIAWGDNSHGQCNVPVLPVGLSYDRVATFYNHSVARVTDGSVIAWGENFWGQCNVPSWPAGLIAVDVSAGIAHSVAQLNNGSVVAWGSNLDGRCNVPASPPGVVTVEVAAGAAHTVARRSDGTVVAWGWNFYGQCNVPVLPTGLSFVDLAPGGHHTASILSDGSVVVWGDNSWGQCNVPAFPPGQHAVQLSAGQLHTAALLSDGSIVAWGQTSAGQCNVPVLPPGLRFIALSTGEQHTLAALSDGSVMAWGDNYTGQCNVPGGWPAYSHIQLGGGSGHSSARIDLCTQSIPIAPTALVANGISQSQITLSWTDNATDESGFRIERSLASTGSWSLLDTVLSDVTVYQDASVTCGTTYDYRVSAFNCGGTSGVTQVAAATCFPSPTAYCLAKVNSLGCVPTVGWIGTPTGSGPVDDFHVTASNVLNRKPGLMLWGTQPGSTPLGGGTLCLAPPVIRTAGQTSGGSPAPIVDCTGQYSFHFGHAYIQTYFLGVGQTIRAQYWSRDPGFPSPNSIGLTDGLAFVIGP